MEEKHLDYKTGLKGGLISDKVFKCEISMCRKLNREKGGKCYWGECRSCGVIPLLYKLCKGELLEEPERIETVKKEIFDA